MQNSIGVSLARMKQCPQSTKNNESKNKLYGFSLELVWFRIELLLYAHVSSESNSELCAYLSLTDRNHVHVTELFEPIFRVCQADLTAKSHSK